MTTRQRSTSSSTDPPVRREVVLGVDTHGEMHVAAVTSPLGKVLGNESFAAPAAGSRQRLVGARHRGVGGRATRVGGGFLRTSPLPPGAEHRPHRDDA